MNEIETTKFAVIITLFTISLAVTIVSGIVACCTYKYANNSPLNKAHIDHEQIEPEEEPFAISSAICIASLAVTFGLFYGIMYM